MIRQRDLPLDTHYGGGTCVTLRHLCRPLHHARTRAYSLTLYIIKYTRMGIGSKDKWTVISDDEFSKGTGSKGGQTLSGFKNCLRLKCLFPRGASVTYETIDKKQITRTSARSIVTIYLHRHSTNVTKCLLNTYLYDWIDTQSM